MLTFDIDATGGFTFERGLEAKILKARHDLYWVDNLAFLRPG